MNVNPVARSTLGKIKLEYGQENMATSALSVVYTYAPTHTQTATHPGGHCIQVIRSSDNYSTGFWPPGSLHTLGADGHIKQRDWLLMAIKILCIEYILWGIPTIESTFDVANMVKAATVKDVPISNDALLNTQAC